MSRLGSHWYITLADLSLILFMATASAVHEDASQTVQANPLPAEGEPVAVYRAGADAPPLRQWLASQGQDDRLRLTIIAHHAGADVAVAAQQAAALAAQAGPQGAEARIVVEGGAAAQVLAVLSYDRAPAWHGDCRASANQGVTPGKDTQCD